jgi:hypothetical protein
MAISAPISVHRPDDNLPIPNIRLVCGVVCMHAERVSIAGVALINSGRWE